MNTGGIPLEVIEAAAKAIYEAANVSALDASDEVVKRFWSDRATRQANVVAPLIWNAALDAATEVIENTGSDATHVHRDQLRRALAAIRVEEEQ